MVWFTTLSVKMSCPVIRCYIEVPWALYVDVRVLTWPLMARNERMRPGMFFIDEHLSAIFNIVHSTKLHKLFIFWTKCYLVYPYILFIYLRDHEQYKHKCFYLWIVLIFIFSPLVDFKTHKVTEHTKLTGHMIQNNIQQYNPDSKTNEMLCDTRTKDNVIIL